MKKLMALLMVTLMTVLAFSAPVLAASESDIISALKAARVAKTYISLTESYLAQDNVTLTETQINTIVAAINKASAIADGTADGSAAEVTGDKVKDLSKDEKLALAAEVAKAAAAIGLTTRVDSVTGISILDASGKVLASATTTTIRKTGNDYTLVFVGLAVLAAAAVSAVVIRKVSGKTEEECTLV